MASRNKPPREPEQRTQDPPPATIDQVPSVGPPKQTSAAQTTAGSASPSGRDAEQDPQA